MKRKPIQVNEHIIHLRAITSDKPTSILLVHGLGISGDYYIPFAKELAAYYNVYIIDLPGYGKTPKPSKALDITQLSTVLLQFVAQLHVHNLIVSGQSMGCQIVAHAITQQPDTFKKAILLAPTVNKKERTVSLQGIRLFQDTFHEPMSANILVFTNYARMGVSRFLKTACFMVNDHIEDTLKKNTIPVLLLRGENDKIVPKEWASFLASNSPYSTSSELPNAPHLLHYAQPKSLTNICRAFIEQ